MWDIIRSITGETPTRKPPRSLDDKAMADNFNNLFISTGCRVIGTDDHKLGQLELNQEGLRGCSWNQQEPSSILGVKVSSWVIGNYECSAMNLYTNINLDSLTEPGSAPEPFVRSHHPSPPITHTELQYPSPHYQPTSHHGGGVWSPGPGCRPPVHPLPAPTVTPSPALATPPSCQVFVIIPSPDPRLSPLPSQCSEDTCPDLECSICFSQFNNIFNCPKMLQCRHTFCLECLARINVKSADPKAVLCPLCRSLTPLPALGLPKLATDPHVLSYLPAAMQRVYSIRFHRSKGKLQVKRSSEAGWRWGRRSLTSWRSVNRSLDVGLPSPPVRGRAAGVGGALFRLTGQPACRAFLLTSVVMMMVLLTGIVIFLLIFHKDEN
ncbi:uncharacterized protein ACBR49_020648 [Aulostomus maculatus]